jgi:hypothetical protein
MWRTAAMVAAIRSDSFLAGITAATGEALMWGLPELSAGSPGD